jgi:hypothetical protein
MRHATGDLAAHLFMQLEDVTAKFRYPCVTDIKIGAQTHDPTASQEKIAYEKRKCPQAAQIGFRLLGMKVKSDSHGDTWRNRAFELAVPHETTHALLACGANCNPRSVSAL